MPNSKHIFIQVDTNSIALLLPVISMIKLSSLPEQEKKEQIDAIILQHVLIFNQGSMSVGSVISKFTIHVAPCESVYFTILPLQLFSRHKLTFHYIGIENTPITTGTNPSRIPFKLLNSSPVSFGIEIGSDLRPDISESFSLHGILEIEGLDPIDICIDPKLQADQ